MILAGAARAAGASLSAARELIPSLGYTWVAIPRGGVDPQGFWLSVLDALRDTVIGAPLVRELTGAPDLDAWSIVERLLDDLRSLEQPVWLVIDDLHELRSEDALRQLELLLMRAPDELRFFLALATTCDWGCTGCASKGNSPRSARAISASRPRRRAPCSKRPEWSCPIRPLSC